MKRVEGAKLIYRAQEGETLLPLLHGFVVAHPDRPPVFRSYEAPQEALSLADLWLAELSRPDRLN